ncbi:MAG: hypothetical protein K0R57_4577 [Paenibacillaceae bacterium]|nr:hypothetical protein [Paenibacillaceae bacterium]
MKKNVRRAISLFLISVIVLTSLGIVNSKPVKAQNTDIIIEHDTSNTDIPEYSETPAGAWSTSGINGYTGGIANGSRATTVLADSFADGIPNRYVKWTPKLTAGFYKVSVWRTVRPVGQDPSVGILVAHAGAMEKLTTSQTGIAGWDELGTYYFAGDGSESVMLYRTTASGAKDQDGNTIFTHADSVKFEPAAPSTGDHIFITPKDFTSLGTWSYDVSQGYNSVCLFGLQIDESKIGTAADIPAVPAEVPFEVTSAGEYRIWFHTKDFKTSPGLRYFEAEVNGQRLPQVFGQHGQDGWKWEDGGVIDLQPGQSNIKLIDTSRFYARIDGILLTSDTVLTPPEDYSQLIALAHPDNGEPDDSMLAYPEWATTQAASTQQAEIKNERAKVKFNKIPTPNGDVIKKQMSLYINGSWVPIEDQNNEYGYLLMYANSSLSVGVRADGYTQTKNMFPLWLNTYDNNGIEKRVMTQDIYRSAMPSWLIPSSMEVLDNQTVRLKAENDYAVATITWTLSQDSDDPVVNCSLQAKKEGSFSLGMMNGAESSLSDVNFLFDPIRITQQGFPDKSYLVTEQYSTAAASFMTLSSGASPIQGSEITYGIAVDPSSIPYHFAKQDDSRFGLSIRGKNGGVQPALFAPLFGLQDSKLTEGALYEISYRPVVREGDWYEAYTHIVKDIFGLTDYRKNYYSSLTDATFNVQNLLMNDTYGGWDSVAKAHYNMEGKNIVSQADNLTYLQSYLLTEDTNIYEKRTIPSLEYLLTRGSFHFSAKPKSERSGNSAWMSPTDEFPIGDPVKQFGTSTFGGAYEMTKGLVPDLRRIGIDNGVRNGGTAPLFAEYVWLYNFTGNQDYLTKAKQEADKYLAGDFVRMKSNVLTSGFISYHYTPYLPGLLDLYEASGDNKYLEAASETARWLMTLIWTQPGIPQGDISIDAEALLSRAYNKNTIFAWRGDIQKVAGIPENLDKLQDETVPAWVTSRTGLTIEDVATFNSTKSHNITMANWAPDMLRLARYTGDQHFETTARNAIIGRAANYPGYYITDLMVHNMKADYPYEGPDITNSIYYHHIPTYLAMLQDFIITQAWKWSDGKIDFPSVRQQGYVWFYNRHYGFEAGKFFDEDNMWLWLKEGLVKPDNIQIDWVAARKDGKVGIALMNEDSDDITTTVELGVDITDGKDYSVTATVYDASGAKSTVPVFDGKLTVTVPGHQLLGIILDAPNVTAPGYAQIPSESLETAAVGQTVAKPLSDNDFGTGIVLQIDPESYYAYVYTTQKPAQIQKAILHYKIGDGEWQQKENSIYPFEFTVKVANPSQAFNFYVEVIDHSNVSLASQQKVLNTLDIDHTPPEFKLAVDGNDLKDGGTFEDNQSLTFSAWDRLTGLASAQIKVTDAVYGILLQGQSSVDLDLSGKPGSYTATITAVDYAGNSIEENFSFIVTTSINSMRSLINRYVEAGKLIGPLVVQLENSLDQAQHKLNTGKTVQAAKHMEDLLKHLNNKALASNVKDNLGAILGADAKALIKTWRDKQ